MDPLLLAICAAEGVWLRHEASALGYHDAAIERLVKAGDWHRVRWGAYTFGEIWTGLNLNERYALVCRAAYRRSDTAVALSHRSSANEWGTPLWEVDLGLVDLTRADGRTGRLQAGVRQHRGRIVAGDWVQRNGVFVMSATRTALELTTILDMEHSLVEIEDLLHRGLTTQAQLRERYGVMNRWPDTLRTDLVLRRLCGRSESIAEVRLRHLCFRQHLPEPIPNYEIEDRQGRVLYRVDLAWPELGLFVEIDGREKYLRHRRDGESIAECIERERRRENHIRELTGWRCLRLVWADLYQPERTAGRIRAMFSMASV